MVIMIVGLTSKLDADEGLVFETSNGVEPISIFDGMGINLLRGIYNYGLRNPRLFGSAPFSRSSKVAASSLRPSLEDLHDCAHGLPSRRNQIFRMAVVGIEEEEEMRGGGLVEQRGGNQT